MKINISNKSQHNSSQNRLHNHLCLLTWKPITMIILWEWKVYIYWVSSLVVSDSLRSHGLYNTPDSSAHGILQARILEWVAISFSNIYINYIQLYNYLKAHSCFDYYVSTSWNPVISSTVMPSTSYFIPGNWENDGMSYSLGDL